MWKWIKRKFSRALKGVRKFIRKAIPLVLELVFIEIKDYAISSVKVLNYTTLSNEEKRNNAFNSIKKEAKLRGLKLKDSIIFLLIELCVVFLKNLRSEE